MNTHRRSHHHTSSGRRRLITNDTPDLASVASSVSPRAPSPIVNPLGSNRTSAGAAALLLAFSVASIVQLSKIVMPLQQGDSRLSPLRRSLQGESYNSKEYIIPIADPASNEDVAILWQEKPFSPSVIEYYHCMGKRLTGKIEQNGVTETHVEVEDDWTDDMAKLALMPKDISELVQSGAVSDLFVATDKPMTAVNSMLSEKQKGRMLGLFHHPVERVALHFSSLHHSENNAKYKAHYIENMESDVMVKKILGLKPTDDVSVADLRLAMNFVRDYVVVGLTSEQEESVRRFNKALGFDEGHNSHCTINPEPASPDEEQKIAPNSQEWLAIAQKSPLDMMLFNLIEKLFEEQYEIFDEYSDLDAPEEQVLWTDTFNSSHLAAFDGPFSNQDETPFFWHVPRTRGSHLQDFYWCMDKSLANQVGGEPRFNKIVPRHLLKEFQPWKEHGNEAKVLNVNMATRNGIVHAKSLGLLSQPDLPRPDIIFSSQFYHLSTILFSSQHKARVFSLFRHPVERAESRFRSLQQVNKAWANMSVDEWATQGSNEANWMVHQLVGKNQDEAVNIKDLEVAKGIVRDKFIVGLSEKYLESLRRFNMLLGIDRDDAKTQECLQSHATPPVAIQKVAQGSPTYVTLMSVNFLDAMLYTYAEELFENQGELFKG